jgi:hypothetical protein
MLPRTRFLTLAFAACVAVCPLECIAHSAQGAGVLVESFRLAAAGQNIPLKGDLLHCPNESGCMCRGAVLVVPVVAPALDLSAWDFLALPPTFNVAVADRALPELAPPNESSRSCAPNSGKILRTLIGSFLC